MRRSARLEPLQREVRELTLATFPTDEVPHEVLMSSIPMIRIRLPIHDVKCSIQIIDLVDGIERWVSPAITKKMGEDDLLPKALRKIAGVIPREPLEEFEDGLIEQFFAMRNVGLERISHILECEFHDVSSIDLRFPQRASRRAEG